jgi:hypothetical protein
MTEAIFLRLLETDDKAAGLAEVVRRPDARAYFVSTRMFDRVPGSPFSYWVARSLSEAFAIHPGLQKGERRFAIRGAYTMDDFRFYRLAFEVPGASADRSNRTYPAMSKGGGFGRYYFDPHLVVRWQDSGAAAKAFLASYRASKGWGEDWSACLNGYSQYYRPGLTWPRRTTSGLSVRVLPAEGVFGDKGPAIFVADDDSVSLLALCAVMNSRSFAALVELQTAAADAAARSYEVGLIQQTPVPDLSQVDERELAALARESWSARRGLDSVTETSHAFGLPALLRRGGDTLAIRTVCWIAMKADVEGSLADLQAQIDDRCFTLYGIDVLDRASIERGFGSADASDEPSVDDGDADEPEDVGADDLVRALVSWAVGVAFGRFDLRLATGERALPPEPDPFGPLPACAPGMLAGDDGLPLAAPPLGYRIAFPTNGILVDDPGADHDLLVAVRRVFAVVFGDAVDERVAEAVTLLDPRSEDFRPWFRSTFFAEHIQRYSKSRRKAPIYWRLGTPSGSYSMWLYLHRVGPDTLHAVLRDHVEPKLRYEEDCWHGLTAEAGPTPSTAQRKELAAQEAFVDELRALRDELVRVAPLWNPDLDDGVVINASFLHRLFLHTKSWAKECEGHWEKLKAGEYDWAHLAMRLWPERVVPKCADDRSLAIAHGLQDVFWVEGDDGKWSPREVDEATIQRLVVERTSAAVKAALREVSAAPPPPARVARALRPAPVAKAPRERAPAQPAAQLPLDLGGARPRGSSSARDALRAALHGFPTGAAKSELLAASGLDEAQWMPAITELVESGEVERTGHKRGTRYTLRAGGRS